MNELSSRRRVSRRRTRIAGGAIAGAAALAIGAGVVLAAPSSVSLSMNGGGGGVNDSGFTGIEINGSNSQDLGANRQLTGGTLNITSDPGEFIFNSQKNALFVPVNGTAGFTATMVVKGPLPDLTVPNQGFGIWAGTNQDNYVKLFVSSNPDKPGGVTVGSFPVVRLGKEPNTSGSGGVFSQAPQGVRRDEVNNLNSASNSVTLQLKVNPDGTVAGTYTENGGTFTAPVSGAIPGGPPPGLLTDGVKVGVVTTNNKTSDPFFAPQPPPGPQFEATPIQIKVDSFTVEGGVVPSIVGRSPVADATGVGTTANVIVTYDAAMMPASLTGGLKLTKTAGGAAVAGPVTLSAGNTVATLDPAQPLDVNTKYTVAVTGAKNAASVAAPDSTWTFTTGTSNDASAGTGASGECRAVPKRSTNSGGSAKFTLNQRQFQIEQRISSAVLRRLNGIEAWLNQGITAGDLCGGAIGAADLSPDITTAVSGSPVPLSIATPRAVKIAGAKKKSARFKLNVGQLRTNRIIALAALRRATALEKRFAALTGGDFANGAGITQGKFTTGLTITNAGAAATPARSKTGANGKINPGSVAFTVAQMRKNQQTASQAIRKANALLDRITAGLTGANFKNGSITGNEIDPSAKP